MAGFIDSNQHVRAIHSSPGRLGSSPSSTARCPQTTPKITNHAAYTVHTSLIITANLRIDVSGSRIPLPWGLAICLRSLQLTGNCHWLTCWILLPGQFSLYYSHHKLDLPSARCPWSQAPRSLLMLRAGLTLSTWQDPLGISNKVTPRSSYLSQTVSGRT